MRKAIEKFCTKIGLDPLLVQGAGGNISWKDGEILWVKASGMWLVDAEKQDIFVPVDLKKIREEIEKNNYSVDIQALNLSELRPSIETILHSQMPHKVVLHVHAVEILPYLVTKNYLELIDTILGDIYKTGFVDYKKPGPDLARAIGNIFLYSPGTQVLFLQNHGIVVGGDNIDEIDRILNDLVSRIGRNSSKQVALHNDISFSPTLTGYYPVLDNEIHNLVLNKDYFSNVQKNWALYPDHVVFLGKKAFCYNSMKEFILSNERPDLLFIKGVCVYTLSKFSRAKLDQLKCYYNVIARLNINYTIKILNSKEINELLNWDLEKYRMKNSK